LSVVGRTANRDQIIHSIIKPSDDIAPQFQGWEIRKTSGDVITGLQGHLRSGRGASIIPIGGQEVLVSNRELAYFGALPHSLMPEGLEALLSVEEFRDLVAFLAAQK
jgi:putative heme-binding domain-containing protein